MITQDNDLLEHDFATGADEVRDICMYYEACKNIAKLPPGVRIGLCESITQSIQKTLLDCYSKNDHIPVELDNSLMMTIFLGIKDWFEDPSGPVLDRDDVATIE